MNPNLLLLAAALLLAPVLRADDPKPATDATKPVCQGECPVKMVDKIFYKYATDCYGMDWKFLHETAKAESGLDPKNHTGKYVGLFQMDKEACEENLGPYKSFLSCKDLEDPEVNAAITANRFNRLFTGKPYFSDKSNYPGILVTCPNATAEEASALAYVGHNNGPGVLKYVLKKKACTDEEIKKAITSYYEKNPHSRDDGKYLNDKKEEVECKNKKEIEGKLAYRCVDAVWGLKKYAYGKDKIASKLKSLSGLYIPGAKKTKDCPADTGKRVYTAEEIKKSLETDDFK